jgi:hypothetical protein
MYLWKYWRESRITFAVGLLLVGLLLWSAFKFHVGYPGRGVVGYSQNGVALQPAQPIPAQIYLVITLPLTIPLAFLGLWFGSFGVGRDLGEGSGSFLLSRPRKRAFFVWSDWGFGMTQLLVLVVALNAVLAFEVHRMAPGSGPVLIAGEPVSLVFIFVLHCVAGLLLTGLMFGLTYFTSVLVKSRGVLLSIGVIAAYTIAKLVVKHYWPEVTLPDFTLTEFSISRSMIAGFADHLGLSIALRAVLVMAFPIAAQILLQQRDID